MTPDLLKHASKVTAADRGRLKPHLGNLKATLTWVRTYPPMDDLKRALLIEIATCMQSENPIHRMSRGVMREIIRQIQKQERSDLDAYILAEFQKP